MKKATLILLALAAAGYAGAQSGAKFLQGESMSNVNSISPNGKYAVGVNLEPHEWGLDVAIGFKSFMWNVEQETIEWMTALDASDYGKSGYFADVTDDGVVCGWFKDPENTITVGEMGYTETLPLNVAAVWSGGKLINLGLGDFAKTSFNNFNDGSFATAISNDAGTVVGYVGTGNMAVTYPCAWVRDDATGKYEYVKYTMPGNATLGVIEDVSGDGGIAVGYVRIIDPANGPLNVACYWTAPDKPVLLQDPAVTMENGACYAVSNNGKYIAFTYDEREPSLYIVDEDKVVKCGRHADVTGLYIGAVADNGDVFGVYKHGAYMTGDMSNRPFWYSYSNRMMTGFDYFMKFWAPDVDTPYQFSYEAKESLTLVASSTGGNIIAGNDTYMPFIIKTDAVPTVLPKGVNSLKATVTAVGEVALTATLPGNSQRFEARRLVVYRDGKELAEVDAGGRQTVDYVDKGVPAGAHDYTAAIIYADNDNEGKDIESPRSETVKVQMEANFDFPLYDNFDSGSLAANHWAVVKDCGDVEYQSIGCPLYTGLQSTAALNTTVMESGNYSYSAVSRHIDATDKETVYASFARKWEYVNSRDWDLDKDTVSLEVSTDGENWLVAKDMRLCDMPLGWSFEYVDLTPWAAGKVFQVRFRMHGTGAAQYLFNADELMIDEKPALEGMTDVLGMTDSEGNFRLSWKNSLGAYPLTYLTNPYYECYGLAIGNEGKPIIAANMFTKEDLAMFKGKYLTSVTLMINHDDAIEGTKDTHASIVIFEDGKLAVEQEFTPEYNTDQIVKLDKPLEIDGTKELKIGVKVYDYDERQLPLPYYNSYGYVEGKSDLYSEDGGATWKKLADVWAGQPNEADGYASWQITGNVTDGLDPEIPAALDLSRFAAEVYKNGEKLSERFVYLLEPGYTDKESVKGDSYQVRVFYIGGECTGLSNTLVNKGTAAGISTVGAAAGDAYTIDGGTLNISGGKAEVELYNASGMKLYGGYTGSLDLNGFGHGLFILKICGQDGKAETYKFTL